MLVEFVELELFPTKPSSVTISSTFLELELVVPFQFHQNWNQFRNLELLVPLHNTTDAPNIRNFYMIHAQVNPIFRIGTEKKPVRILSTIFQPKGSQAPVSRQISISSFPTKVQHRQQLCHPQTLNLNFSSISEQKSLVQC